MHKTHSVSFQTHPLAAQLSYVETSILTVFNINKCFIGEKKAVLSIFALLGRNLAEFCIFVPSLASFCLSLQLTSQNINKKSSKMTVKMAQNGPQTVRKQPKKGPKKPQNGIKTTQKWCQNGAKVIPKRPRIHPEMVQNHPKMTPKRVKRASKTGQMTPKRP